MAKLTRKSYKRRKIIMGVTLFGAVGLISTGFAAWVLSASAETTQDGSLSVGTVTDTNMKFSNVKIGTVDSNPTDGVDTFLFEPLSTDSTGRVRYDNANAERLALKVTGQLEHAENLGLLYVNLAHTDKTVPAETNPENIPATPNSNGWTTDLDEAVGRGYIALPEAYHEDKVIFKVNDPDAKSTKATYSYDGVTTTATFAYVVEFTWGQFFAGLNPGVFFDLEDYSASKTYAVGDYVIHGVYAYKCTTAITAPEAWKAEHWEAASSQMRADYDATSTYAVGAVVNHEGTAYKCIEAIGEGGEAWNAEHWQVTSAMFTDAEVANHLVKLHDLLDQVKLTLTITADPT